MVARTRDNPLLTRPATRRLDVSERWFQSRTWNGAYYAPNVTSITTIADRLDAIEERLAALETRAAA